MHRAIEDEALPPVMMPSCEVRRTLAGQKGLVTGASSGIGKGVAIALGKAAPPMPHGEPIHRFDAASDQCQTLQPCLAHFAQALEHRLMNTSRHGCGQLRCQHGREEPEEHSDRREEGTGDADAASKERPRR
jgi:hypothetical protein